MQFEPAATNNRSARSVASLEDYLEAIANRKLLVVACVALGLIAVAGATKDRVPYYEASASVLLNPSPYGTTDGRLVDPNLEREAAVLVGQDIQQAVRAELSLQSADDLGDSASSTYTPESDVITVKVTASDPERTAELANRYVEVYERQRIAQQSEFYEVNISAYADQLAEVEASIVEAQTEVFGLDQRIQDLRAQEYSIDRDVQINTFATQRGNLGGQISSDQAVMRTIQQASSALERNRDGGKPAAVRLTTAEVPASPIGIPTSAFYVAGAILGLLLGVVLAFLRERLDRRAQSSRDVELALAGRVIGSIPRFGWRFRRGPGALVMANGR